MTCPDLPAHLVPCGSTRTFTRDSLPDALQREHSLRPGRWGRLHLLEGSAWFVDLEGGEEVHLVAPTAWTIEPEARHRLRVDGPVECRIDFFEAPEG